MAIKKKAKSKKRVQRAPVAQKVEGFFARNRDIIPQAQQAPQKSVRVKTFIVEKPIIIHEKPQHINAGNYEDDEEKYDSKKSRYKKKFRGVELEDAPNADELTEEDDLGEDGLTDEDALGDDSETADDSLGDEDALSDDAALDEDGNEIPSEEQIVRKHARSRGMIQNVWWKKALLWAVLVWLLILILEFAMQSIKLVEVDLTRQWWFLLGGLIVVSFVYFGIIESRFKI